MSIPCEQQTQLLDGLHQYLEGKEVYLDKFIEHGSDHDLFIASYIHGHFSVIAANMMRFTNQPQATQFDLSDLCANADRLLQESIHTAIENKELSEQDTKEVLDMLAHLFAI